MNSRKETIVVDKVLRRWPSYSAGFPAAEILDTNGKKHLISSLDVMSNCNREEFERMGRGSTFTIIVKESIASVRLTLSDSKKERVSESEYTWSCDICRRGGSVSSGILTEVDSRGFDAKRVIDSICKAHESASPNCQNQDIEVFDQNLVSMGRLPNILTAISSR
jgi:hypothetical protein